MSKPFDITPLEEKLPILLDEAQVEGEARKRIESAFGVLYTDLEEWTSKSQELTVSSESHLTEMEQSALILKEIKKAEKEIEIAHRTAKEPSLRECQALDKIKRTFLEKIEPIKSKLKNNVNYLENKKREEETVRVIKYRQQLAQYNVKKEIKELIGIPDRELEEMVLLAKEEFEEKERQAERLIELEKENKKLREEKKRIADRYTSLSRIGMELDTKGENFRFEEFYIPKQDVDTISDEEFSKRRNDLILAVGAMKARNDAADRKAIKAEVRKELEEKSGNLQENNDYQTIIKLLNTLENKEGIKTKAGHYVIDKIAKSIDIKEIKEEVEKYKDYLENKK